MLKKATKVNFIYNGEHKIEDTYLKEIKLNWNKYKNNKKYYDGDIYCVDEIIDNNIPQVIISKTKFSSLLYAKQTKKIVIRSLFSGSYIKTKDNYICIIINNRGVLNLIGEWTTDGVTIYEFYKDNTGILKTSLSEYDFKYKIEEDKLSIDFKNEKSEDSEYTYKITKDKLVLEGKNGKFNFKRK